MRVRFLPGVPFLKGDVMAPIDPKKHDVWDTGLIDRAFDSFDKVFDHVDKAFDHVDNGFDKLDGVFDKLDGLIWDTRTKPERIKEAQQRMRMAKDRVRRESENHWEVKRENTLRKNKKVKSRRFKMAAKGIGIGGIIFWAFIGYQIWGGGADDADEKGTAETKSLETQVIEKVKEVKTQFDGVVQKAKDEYAKAEPKSMKRENNKPDPIPAKDDDDLYGSDADRY